MVTGDNKFTAEAIAVECGIIQKSADYKSEDHVLVGEDFWKAIGGIQSVDKIVNDKVVLDKFKHPV